MDYQAWRHTEDFARQLEDATLRAHDLRRQASEDFWNAVGAGLRAAARAVWRWGATGGRRRTSIT